VASRIRVSIFFPQRLCCRIPCICECSLLQTCRTADRVLADCRSTQYFPLHRILLLHGPPCVAFLFTCITRIDLAWCTVYSNSLLATLNARKSIRGAVDGINTSSSFSLKESPTTKHVPAASIKVRALSASNTVILEKCLIFGWYSVPEISLSKLIRPRSSRAMGRVIGLVDKSSTRPNRLGLLLSSLPRPPVSRSGRMLDAIFGRRRMQSRERFMSCYWSGRKILAVGYGSAILSFLSCGGIPIYQSPIAVSFVQRERWRK
jgi:hypothetical protein